ncbi:hypothetical protein Ahy_A07g036592 [Arachis hypogaea]|uniref:Uncharacterized protein n=1 Tax=Arachis hypogaea TaxID=3818 RepID=A0A445CGI6_ARAHY|nr:hypothetical protein Ahy_A07g036592 [Arachis hypogaea]
MEKVLGGLCLTMLPLILLLLHHEGLLRCGKSFRLKWINYWRAYLKRGNISIEEETIITELHASFGNSYC